MDNAIYQIIHCLVDRAHLSTDSCFLTVYSLNNYVGVYPLDSCLYNCLSTG